MRFSLLTLLLSLALAAPASAAYVQEAADGLLEDPVYVDPDAEAALSSAQEAAVEERIAEANVGPIYVSVLPEEAEAEAGSMNALVRAIQQEFGRGGIYVAVAGRSLEAGGPPGTAEAIDAALAENSGLTNVLSGFVGELEQQRSGGGTDGVSTGGGGLLLALLALGGGAYALSRISRRRRERAELEEVKVHVRDDLVELGEELRALDLDVQMPGANPEAVADYHRAVECYDRAETAWETARRAEDLEPVGAALEEGRWALASTRARLENRPVPERRAPCFFDPRHGPSTRDVVWAPYAGAERMVPACEADALRVEAGEEPYSREVMVGGTSMPYWQAGGAFMPLYGGFFGAGLLPGLFMGSMLGGGFGWGGDIGGGDGGGFSDFGGGDFGGGDFGGGDF